MSKRVVIIASCETERRALPHLVAHLALEDISVVGIRIPAGNRALDVEMAEKLIKAAWWAPSGGISPDKFVILVDTDGKVAEQVLSDFRVRLPGRVGPAITASILFAFAQWHLEAWYFADGTNLRTYVGGNLGSIDDSKPDEILNPKLHLCRLLGKRVYTAEISEQIAQTLDAKTIADRSPSFQGFLESIRNGSTS